MPATISDTFRIFNAQKFLNSLSDPTFNTVNTTNYDVSADTDRTFMYFFIGRPQPWNTYLEIYSINGTFTVGEQVYVGANLGSATFKGTVVNVYPNSLMLSTIGPSQTSAPAVGSILKGNSSTATALTGIYRYATEDVPPLPFDNQSEKFAIYDDMMAIKRITSTYARAVVRRWNWDTINNPSFEMWKSNYSLSNLTDLGNSSLGTNTSKFFVMNANYEVFMCLYNGKSPSNPTGTSVNPNQPPSTTPSSGAGTFSDGVFTQSDGNYIWQYLYTIPTNDVISFLTTDFIPISSYTTQSINPVDGQIKVVYIKDYGSNLPNGTGPFYAPILGDGTGGVVRIVTASNSITSVSLISGGSGYTYASVAIKSGTGSGSTAYGLFSDSALTSPATITGTATIEVVIPPQGGYGSNLIAQLNAKRVMLNVRLIYADGSGDFPINSQFRRIGILQNPTIFGSTTTRIVQNTASTLYAVRLNNVSGSFIDNELITQTVGGNVVAQGTVVSWSPDTNSTTGVLRYIQSRGNDRINGIVGQFKSSNGNITGQTSLLTGTIDITYGGSSPITITAVSSGNSSTFTGSISGTTLTMSSNASGIFAIGQTISGNNVYTGTVITTLLTGTSGLSGSTYTVSVSQNVNSTSITSQGGNTSKLTFASQSSVPFVIGEEITVSGVTDTSGSLVSGYNGTFIVTSTTTTSVSYSSTASGTLSPGNTSAVVYTAFNGQSFINGVASPEIQKNSGNIIYVENRQAITRAADQIEDIKLVIEF